MTGALPHHDLLSSDFGHTAVTSKTENKNANLPCDIAPGIDLDGMNFINLHPGIDSALQEALNGRAAIDTFTDGWEESCVFTVATGNGCAIPGVKGSYELNHGLIEVCAGFTDH